MGRHYSSGLFPSDSPRSSHLHQGHGGGGAQLRREGLLVHPYLDDWLIQPNQSSCAAGGFQGATAFASLGWVINLAKSRLEPTQRLEYLGALFDTERGRVSLSQERVVKLQGRSLIDIQELSSIACEQEKPCKEIHCKTPSARHAPTSVSTPVNPGEKNVSNIILYKEGTKAHSLEARTVDTSCWDSLELPLTSSSTFATACEKSACISVGSHLSSGWDTSNKSLNSVLCSPLTMARTEYGVSLTHTPQKILQKVSGKLNEELPPPPQDLLDEIVQDHRQLEEKEQGNETVEETKHCVWTKEAQNSADKTARAHSTLDERLLEPIEWSESLQEDPLSFRF
ncbi:inactive serine/threonine-protein kinase TEX14-like, partial [Rhinatrema bivittatum]|uniref:inactive serine/threonine-protein kinase TEX14-like n=1 Tax=Rhinatrema bivittatum TaxID=194408 RepID=UPI00112CD21F